MLNSASFLFFRLRQSGALAACVLGFALLTLHAEVPAQGKRAQQVRAEQGVLSGMNDGSRGGEFLGIPYAAPPVGKRRCHHHHRFLSVRSKDREWSVCHAV